MSHGIQGWVRHWDDDGSCAGIVLGAIWLVPYGRVAIFWSASGHSPRQRLCGPVDTYFEFAMAVSLDLCPIRGDTFGALLEPAWTPDIGLLTDC